GLARAERGRLQLLHPAWLPAPAAAEGDPSPEALPTGYRRPGRLPGPARGPHPPYRLGAERAPVRPDGEACDRAPARHRRGGRHPAPLHPGQPSAPDLQGPGRAREGPAYGVRVPVPEQPGTPARNPRGPERGVVARIQLVAPEAGPE